MSSDVSLRTRELVRMLDHPIPETRQRAGKEIVALGRREPLPVAKVLSATLPRSELAIRRRILIVLTELNIAKAIPGLMDYVDGHEEIPGDDTRAIAMRAIVNALLPKHRKHCFDFFIGLRRDPEILVRQLALEGLAKLGDPRAKPFLEEAAQTDDESMIRETASALLATFSEIELDADDAPSEEDREIYSREQLVHKLASREALQRDLGIREILKRFPDDAYSLFIDAIRSGHALARQSGIRGLGATDDPRAWKVLWNLADNPDTSREDRPLALRAMSRVPIPEDVTQEAILKGVGRHLRNDDDLFTVSAALGVVARLTHPDAIDILQTRLAHQDTWIRETAAQAIARVAHPGQKRMLPSLKEALEASGVRAQKVRAATGEWPQSEFAFQESCLVALSRIAEPESSPELMVLPTILKYLAHPHREVQEAAYDFVRLTATQPGDLDDAGLRELLALLGSRKRDVKLDALQIIERVLPERYRNAAPRLVSLIYENDPEITLKAIPLLARTGDREAEQALGRLTRDRNSEVSEAAREALMNFSSQDTFH